MAITVLGTSPWGETSLNFFTQSSLGTEAVGDRRYEFASWKDFSTTATCASTAGAWTELTEFADGTVAAGNGVGSMKVAAWYRDFDAGDDGPTGTLSANANICSDAMIVLRKSATETWDAPLFVTAAWPLGGSAGQTVSASSTVAVPDGAIVMALIGIRDDSATFTRGATTGIDVSSGITWAANYVEDPATHKTTTGGGDMSADFGYRLVTTGGTVTLRVTATLSANETGSVLWVIQGVTATAGLVPESSPYPQLLAH